jgi:hypothetical protein
LADTCEGAEYGAFFAERVPRDDLPRDSANAPSEVAESKCVVRRGLRVHGHFVNLGLQDLVAIHGLGPDVREIRLSLQAGMVSDSELQDIRVGKMLLRAIPLS